MEQSNKYVMITDNTKFNIENHTINIDGVNLYRIIALKDFSDVRKGDIGGYVESYDNLSQEGNSWLYDSAKCYSNGKVLEDAKVKGNSLVYRGAIVKGIAEIEDACLIYDNAVVGEGNNECYLSGGVQVYDEAEIKGGKLSDGALVYNGSIVADKGQAMGRAVVNNAIIFEEGIVSGNAYIENSVVVRGQAEVGQNTKLTGVIQVGGNALIYGNSKIVSKATELEDFKIEGNNLRINDDVSIISSTAYIGDNTYIRGKANIETSHLLVGAKAIIEQIPITNLGNNVSRLEDTKGNGFSIIEGNAILKGAIGVVGSSLIKDSAYIEGTDIIIGNNVVVSGTSKIVGDKLHFASGEQFKDFTFDNSMIVKSEDNTQVGQEVEQEVEPHTQEQKQDAGKMLKIIGDAIDSNELVYGRDLELWLLELYKFGKLTGDKLLDYIVEYIKYENNKFKKSFTAEEYYQFASSKKAQERNEYEKNAQKVIEFCNKVKELDKDK